MGERMTITELKKSVLPSLLTGTARQPLSSDAWRQSNGALAALSLVGQSLRFERPAAPVSFAVEPVIEDKRRILSDHLRRPMLRLLSGKNSDRAPGQGCGAHVRRTLCAAPPFDLPKLDAFVREYAEALGISAQHWAQRQQIPLNPQATTRTMHLMIRTGHRPRSPSESHISPNAATGMPKRHALLLKPHGRRKTLTHAFDCCRRSGLA
jgi:hypothetical protein